MKLWKQLLKDVLLTGTGIAVILLQAFSAHPYPYLILAGLALTVPSVADHVKALLPGGEPPSPSSERRGRSASSSSASSPQVPPSPGSPSPLPPGDSGE